METYGNYVDSRTKEYTSRMQEQRQQDKAKKSKGRKGRGGSSYQERRSDERFRKHLQDMAYRFAYGVEPPKPSPEQERKRYRSLVDAARGRG